MFSANVSDCIRQPYNAKQVFADSNLGDFRCRHFHVPWLFPETIRQYPHRRNFFRVPVLPPVIALFICF
jgi:hypothetical protein